MSHPIATVFPSQIHDRMHDVEQRLQKAGESREPSLQAWTQEPLAAGGKRIRPLLLLTSFAACHGTREPEHWNQAVDAAVALELVHTASLVHDDIMDESAERRGQPSTYAAHGRDGAILVGDFLFTQAFALAATLPKDAMDLTADACRRLCEGQLRERRVHEERSTSRDDYNAVIRDKTAVLLSAACGIGAIMAGAEPATVERMSGYGTAIGHAFQVLDDVLDVTGDPQWTGKPAGSDFAAGTLSSPYLHLLERGGNLPTPDTVAFPEVRERLFESGAVAASQLEASTYTQDALLRVEGLPAGPARDALARLAELLMERAQ